MTYDSSKFKVFDKKVILKVSNFLCDSSTSLVTSLAFKTMVKMSIQELKIRKSLLLDMFGTKDVSDDHTDTLLKVLEYLTILPIDEALKLVPNSGYLLENKHILFDYVDYLYDFWRSYDRFVISIGDPANRVDKRPYRTFNSTIESLTENIRKTYRDIQENILYSHPNIYRQIQAGAGFATIALPKNIPFPRKYKQKLSKILIMRQILLNPPIVLKQTMNKRNGTFTKVDQNPIDFASLNPEEWLCYPAKVGTLTILIYIHETFYELGFSLANLFEIASNKDLKVQPDGIYFYGLSDPELIGLGNPPTIFHDDKNNHLMVGAVPNRPEFGYFGYLKKMVLTLHNVIIMKQGSMPFHGSLTQIVLRGLKKVTVLVIGDSGAGKSETLEALREIGEGIISDIKIIADDMGSIKIDSNGDIIGYGTEIGAFLRLDDLSPSSTFGAIDRAIFMSVNQINSRVVIPVTTLHTVLSGTKIDFVFYANNYEEIGPDHPIIEQFQNSAVALETFREGKSMAKGTTTATGLQKNYFVNPFGVPSYMELHDKIAQKFFDKMFEKGIFVGQIRTCLGIKGKEKTGPLEAAKKLIEHIKNA
ncbi:MAG: phosphoenolpyruvate carboxykinase [Promethearchaeota archaeon]